MAITPIFGSLGPQEAVIRTPGALEAFARRMQVQGERPPQLTPEQAKFEAAPFIAGIWEWAEREKESE